MERVRRLTKLLMIAALAAGMLSGAFYFWAKPVIKQYDELAKSLDSHRHAANSVVYDRNGAVLGEFGAEKRYWVRIEELPRYLVDAFLAAEDRDFYYHPGVSVKAVLRAAWKNLLSGEVVQGGSTVTQQLARSLFLSSEQTFDRKWKEALLAVLIEKRFDKDAILEMYLNCVYLGNNSFGVEAASRNYFRKRASDLNPGEAVLIAGLPQAPSRLAPHRNLEQARRRQKQIFQRMVADHLLSEKEADRWYAFDLRVAKTPEIRPRNAGYLLEGIRRDLQRKLDLTHFETAGLRITTTIDMNLQEETSRLLQSRPEFQNEHLEMAVIDLQPLTGEILSLQGGKDFFVSQFNRVKFIRRPLGSLMFVPTLSLALEKGWPLAASPHSREISLYESALSGDWDIFHAVAENLGLGTMQEFLGRLGLQNDKDQIEALVSPKEVAVAFSAVVAQGKIGEPYYIEKVLDRNGRVLYEHPKMPTQRVLSPQVAYMVRKTLEDFAEKRIPQLASSQLPAVYGFASNLQDSWVAALHPHNVTVGWIGSEYGRERVAGNREVLENVLAGYLADLSRRRGFKARLSREATEEVPQGIHFQKTRLPRLGTSRTLPFKARIPGKNVPL